jgi:hypothetical protein
VPFAHPVFASTAISAVTAGNDLIGDDPVTDSESLYPGAEFDNMAEELVSRHNRFSNPFRLTITAPIPRGAMPRFNVTGANAARLDLDNDFVSSGGGYRNGLKL